MNNSSHIGGLIEYSLDELLANSENISFLKSLSIPENNYILTFSGRSALSIIFEKLELKNGYVILPEFICVESIYPLLKRKKLIPLRFKISKNFEQDLNNILKAIKTINSSNIKAIILCNYFGSKDPIYTSNEFKKSYPNIPIILDSVQDLAGITNWEERSNWADWQVYSFRKSLPIPDGGLLIGSGLEKINFKISSEAKNFSALSLKLSFMRHNFLLLDNKNENKILLEKEYLNLLSSIKKKVPYSSEPITNLSNFIISKINISEALSLRNRNYCYFCKKASQIKFIKLIRSNRIKPSSNFVPILISNNSRNKVRDFLKSNNIFCPIHWKQTNEIYKTLSEYGKSLSDNILSIPVDQRYSTDDIDRIIDVLMQYSLIENKG